MNYWFDKYNKFFWLLTIIIVLMIFYISSLTFEGSGGTGYMSYVYHFTAFSYLSLFLLISLTKGKYSKNLIIMGVVLAILYGISDEIHQYFVPGRESALRDVLLNSIGILVTSISYSNYLKK